MKALVYTAEKEIQYRDEPAPEPGPEEVVVAIDAVGICGSDMHAYLGHDPRRVPPLILGHEAVGKVVEGSTTGPAVVVNPLITCGHCDECLGGAPTFARSGRSSACTGRARSPSVSPSPQEIS